MSKLKIPVNPLLGSPLTAEELKSILGGQVNLVRECHCMFTYGGSIPVGTSCPASVNIEAADEATCKQACQGKCDSHDHCIKSEFHYSVYG